MRGGERERKNEEGEYGRGGSRYDLREGERERKNEEGEYGRREEEGKE